jgi:prepilin-type N-terminal cleavage/methylation domain-containing protein/prepilin-type processing-associated H-X9-DG protein
MLPTFPAMSRGRQPQPPRAPRAFTLAELLVVIGIIAILISVLLPTLAAVRRYGQSVRCRSNLRQIAAGFILYSAENRHRYPPYLSAESDGSSWFKDRYLGNILARDGIAKGNALFTCPQDEESQVSYAVNIWMASAIDPEIPPVGRLWGPTPRNSAQVILALESWSYKGSFNSGYSANPYVGYRGVTPGQRFGAAGGVTPYNASRFGVVNCEIDYSRHRPRSHWAQRTQPGGVVNIAYADGHVAPKTESDLVNRDTGLSTLDSLWSPLDEQQNATAAAAAALR